MLGLFFSCPMGDISSGKNKTETAEYVETKSNGKQASLADNDADDEAGEEDNLIFLDFVNVSEREFIYEFSHPIKVISLQLIPDKEIEAVEESGSTVKITLADEPEPGLKIQSEMIVEEESGNSITVTFTFRTRNNRVPALQINEMRTEFSGTSLRAEFIEFKILSEGNLGALRVFAASNSKNPLIYEFEPVEVNRGDYIVLHLRTLEASCMDEYGDRLDESGGNDSSPFARDFWIPGSGKLLRKTDSVYVLDQDDQILDAVMITEKITPWWENNYLAVSAEFLYSQSAWRSTTENVPGPMDAVNSSGIGSALTRSISRNEGVENSHTATDWFVTANNGATPGKPNVPK